MDEYLEFIKDVLIVVQSADKLDDAKQQLSFVIKDLEDCIEQPAANHLGTQITSKMERFIKQKKHELGLRLYAYADKLMTDTGTNAMKFQTECETWLEETILQANRSETLVAKTEADTVNTVSANQRAKRWAMMNFDKWNEVTGFVDPHISYYDEITALIEDAVEFGCGVALKQPLKEIMKIIKKSEGSL